MLAHHVAGSGNILTVGHDSTDRRKCFVQITERSSVVLEMTDAQLLDVARSIIHRLEAKQ